MVEGPRETIGVTVRVFGGLRDLAGRAALVVPAPLAPDVASLRARLRADHPALADALDAGLRDGYLNALVNGRNVRFLAGDATPLADGDSVAFLPPIGGG